MEVEGLGKNELLFILGIAGFIILLLFGALSFFLKIVHSDVRKNTENTGKNKGRIDQLSERQDMQHKHISEMMETHFTNLKDQIRELTEIVKTKP